jgi:histidine triad (HIT) family protein
MNKQNCLFCNIANGIMEAATIFENSEFKVILDKFPASKGHTLIIPKEHIENIYELDGETAGKLFALATLVANELKKVLNCDGMNILQNNGEIAGQTVFHFHMHLIPRYEGDGLKFNWETKQFTDDELAQVAEAISQAI